MTIAATMPDVMSLRDAREHLPGRPHTQTIQTWILHGVRGPRPAPGVPRPRVYLAGEKVGGRWFVTRQAVETFIAELTPERAAELPSPRDRYRRRQARRRHRRNERNAEFFESVGIMPRAAR